METVTTRIPEEDEVLLQCTADGVLSADEAKDVLYELVDAGMNLDPKVYVRLQKELDELGR